MSSFKCEYCGKDILDSPSGYITGCEHYPIEPRKDIAQDIARVSEGFDEIASRVTTTDMGE